MLKIEEKIKDLKKRKKIIGLVHGVFDVLHIGHIWYFEEARKNVDYLIASVTSDKFVNKGPGKPIFGVNKRIEMLRSIKLIDEVIESNEATACQNIKLIKPDFYIKGQDYKDLKKDITNQILIEKKIVEKYGGQLIFTDTKLHSSSSVINQTFDYINGDAKNLISEFKKKNFLQKFNSSISKVEKNNILIIGDPILDIIRFVKPSGKSNKNNIISTQYINEEINEGGVFLPLKFINLFCDKISFINTGDKKGLKIVKKINKNIKIINFNANINLIKKIRYIDSYSYNRLFQTNENESKRIKENVIKKIINFINNNHKKYKNIIFFDYGYSFLNSGFEKKISKFAKKLIINCQTNSYNFGFNIADKYKKNQILSMDEAEFRLIARDKTSELRELILKNKKKFKNNKILIITQGKIGCYILNKNTLHFIPSIIKPKIDTTGSGDIFLMMFFISYCLKNFLITESAFLSHVAAGIHANDIGNRFNFNKNEFIKIINNMLK